MPRERQHLHGEQLRSHGPGRGVRSSAPRKYLSRREYAAVHDLRACAQCGYWDALPPADHGGTRWGTPTPWVFLYECHSKRFTGKGSCKCMKRNGDCRKLDAEGSISQARQDPHPRGAVCMNMIPKEAISATCQRTYCSSFRSTVASGRPRRIRVSSVKRSKSRGSWKAAMPQEEPSQYSAQRPAYPQYTYRVRSLLHNDYVPVRLHRSGNKRARQTRRQSHGRR
jgi:hypothetical protein